MSLANNLNAALVAAKQVSSMPLDLTDSFGNSPKFAFPLAIKEGQDIAFLGPLTARLADTALDPETTTARRGEVVLDTYVVRSVREDGSPRYLFAYVCADGYVAGFDRSFGSDLTLTKVRMQAVRQRLVRIDPATAILAISRTVEAGFPMNREMADALEHFTEVMRQSPLAVLAIAATAPAVYESSVVAQAASLARNQFRGRPASFTTALRVLDTLLCVNGTTFVKANARRIRELVWGSSRVEEVAGH